MRDIVYLLSGLWNNIEVSWGSTIKSIWRSLPVNTTKVRNCFGSKNSYLLTDHHKLLRLGTLSYFCLFINNLNRYVSSYFKIGPYIYVLDGSSYVTGTESFLSKLPYLVCLQPKITQYPTYTEYFYFCHPRIWWKRPSHLLFSFSCTDFDLCINPRSPQNKNTETKHINIRTRIHI